MNSSLASARRARRGRALATSTLAAAVLALGLAGCGDDTSTDTDRGSTPGTSSSAAPSAPTSSAVATADAPETEPATAEVSETPASLDGLGKKDDLGRVDFADGDVVFADSGSARSDGTYLYVTTGAEEKFSVRLPTEADGWIYDITVDLGDAGTGYLVTQSGGEYLNTFLVVLDDGELYLPKASDEVVFGQFAGEGPSFETYTTDAGAHLVTRVEDQGPSGETEFYEWSVEGRTMVPTQLS